MHVTQSVDRAPITNITINCDCDDLRMETFSLYVEMLNIYDVCAAAIPEWRRSQRRHQNPNPNWKN
jgi:hypothetical protein